MTTITEPAPAKINLALHLRRRRPDGYHDLETLFAFARDGDTVTMEEADQDSFDLTGPMAYALRQSSTRDDSGHDNLVVKARDAFRAIFGCPPVAITLDKHLPIASGIGGGSADAAATLRALARLTGTDPADRGLFNIAARLGADVPACLLGETAFATGRGDDLEPLPPLGGLPLLLVNPRVPLPTGAMFAAWDRIDRGGIAGEGSAMERAQAGRNDFTAPAIAQAPVIADVIDRLARAPGCTLARLSGSGATCFSIFTDDAGRDSAADTSRQNGWWTLATYVK